MKRWTILFYDSLVLRLQFCQLPCCNLFTHLVSFGETPLVNCGPRSYFSTLLATIFTAFHDHLLVGHISSSSYSTSTHLIHCVCQAGKIDNLYVLLGQSSLLVIVCRSTSIVINGTVDTLLSLLQVLLDSKTFVLKSRENYCYAASYLPQRTCDPRHQWTPGRPLVSDVFLSNKNSP